MFFPSLFDRKVPICLGSLNLDFFILLRLTSEPGSGDCSALQWVPEPAQEAVPGRAGTAGGAGAGVGEEGERQASDGGPQHQGGSPALQGKGYFQLFLTVFSFHLGV